jgi:hypothetical protein
MTVLSPVLRAKLSRWAGVLTGVQQIHEAPAELRREHEAATQRRLALFGPASRGDQSRGIRFLVAAQGDAWLEANHQDLGAVSGAISASPMPPGYVIFPPRLPLGLEGPLTFGALAAIAPTICEAGLNALVARLPQVEPGPDLAERPALIAKEDNTLAEIEAAHTALVDEAQASAGITLELLPVVAQRRRVAEIAAERQARVAAAEATVERVKFRP